MNQRKRVIRRGSLILLLVWMAVLIGALIHAQLRRQPPMAPVQLGDVAKQREETPVRVQKGFVYNDVLGVEPNFRIAARETVEYASGWYELRDVDVSLYRNGQVAYGLVAEKARFNPAKKEAIVTGEVQVSLAHGIALRADQIVLHGADRDMESVGGVTFAGPGWGGSAGRLAVAVGGDLVKLVDGVSVSVRQSPGATQSLIILAPEVTYSRGRALAAFPRGLTVLRAGLRLTGADGEIQLKEPSGTLRNAVIRAPVRVDGVMDDGSYVRLDAGETRVEALASGGMSVTALPAADTGWVEATWTQPDGSWRHFTAWRLVGRRSATQWEWLEGQEKVCADERVPDGARRGMEADLTRLTFDDGHPTTVHATGAVTVRSGTDWASGDDLTYSALKGTFVLLPTGTSRVRFGAPDLAAECDRIAGGRDGAVTARGQVNGVVTRKTARQGAATGPVRFASDSAQVQGDDVVLDGDARLWQGDRLLRADHMVYHRAAETVSGSGHVVTTSTMAGTNGEKPAQVRISARSVEYDRATATVTYEGTVEVEDPQAVSSCQKLVVKLGRAGEIQEAELTGGVEVRERGSNRTLKGDRARLVSADDLLEVWGKPVLLQEPGGNQIKGDKLEWRRDSNSVLVVGSDENPSETIYTPATPSPSANTGAKTPGKGLAP